WSLNRTYPPGTYVSKEEIVPRLVNWANTHPKSRSQTKHLASLVPTNFMREIKLRKGKTAEGLEDTKDRVSYKEGGLLYVLGWTRIGELRCEHCKKGRGPFDGCIALPGFMNGVCANCRYDDYQNRCRYQMGKSEEESGFKCFLLTSISILESHIQSVIR
ncbi:hypothetical protein N431DRAFT_357134, partial [Stipitochalara longipes BDJ]